MGLCHRDISLENLMINNQTSLVIDFGMCIRVPFDDNSSTELDNNNHNNNNNNHNNGMPAVRGRRLLITPQGTCGKWHYMSPEIVNNREPFDGYAIDLWAAGIILFIMLTGFPPWEKADDSDERFKYMSRGYMVQLLTEWDLGLSPEAMDLLQKMLYKDPRKRLSLKQVWSHAWVQMGATGGDAGSSRVVVQPPHQPWA